MDDRDIIELYWGRCETAIAETAKKYGSYCRQISFRILHNDQDAEECVNDTWMRAWNTIPPQRPRRLSAYLGKIARNLALDRYRSFGAEKRTAARTAVALEELAQCVSGRDDVSLAMDERLLAESLDRFLCQQPKNKRIIFLRRYWYMDSIKEISDAFGMSESQITSLLFRLRGQLRRHLEKEGITV